MEDIRYQGSRDNGKQRLRVLAGYWKKLHDKFNQHPNPQIISSSGMQMQKHYSKMSQKRFIDFNIRLVREFFTDGKALLIIMEKPKPSIILSFWSDCLMLDKWRHLSGFYGVILWRIRRYCWIRNWIRLSRYRHAQGSKWDDSGNVVVQVNK